MSYSFVPFIISLVLANRLRQFSKANNLSQLEKQFRYATFFSIMLYALETIFPDLAVIKWIWHIYLVVLVVFPFLKTEIFPLRVSVVAFAPYVTLALLNDFIQLISPELYAKIDFYFDKGITLAIIWMLAIMFSQNRQRKVQEKERIKRQQEDELNRAIAIRKVELEELVAERTAELTRQKEELEQTLHELRSTQAQLIQSEKMASLGELTAGIAHEIQNPLNFVNNFSELNTELIEEMKVEIQAGNSDEAIALAGDISENEKKINLHGKRAEGIVKGMLQHSRSSSGVKEPTDINALADEFLRLAYHGLRAKDKSFNATLKTDLDASIDKLNIVPQDVGRVILNLLTNAFYAVNEKKKSNITGYEPVVSISTARIGNKIEIKVSDNGKGIPQKVMDKIFQPFFTTKPTGEGTGLGLSISYEIITKGHGGEISVETTEGEGTVFSIQLPFKS